MFFYQRLFECARVFWLDRSSKFSLTMNKLDLNAIRRNSVFASGENTDEREKEEDDRDQSENNFIFIFKLLDRTNHGRLRMPEMSCLGEAMIGHPPEEKDIKKQVHHARSRLTANRSFAMHRLLWYHSVGIG